MGLRVIKVISKAQRLRQSLGKSSSKPQKEPALPANWQGVLARVRCLLFKGYSYIPGSFCMCPKTAPARARTLEAGKRWARLAQARAASRPGLGGVAFQAPPGSQASSRGEAKDSALLSSRDAPVFLPGESHGQRSLVGYSPWSCKESDTTEATQHLHFWCKRGCL